MKLPTIHLMRRLAVLGLATTGLAQADLVAFWNFNEGSGTTAKDATANHNDGTLKAISRGSVPAIEVGTAH